MLYFLLTAAAIALVCYNMAMSPDLVKNSVGKLRTSKLMTSLASKETEDDNFNDFLTKLRNEENKVSCTYVQEFFSNSHMGSTRSISAIPFFTKFPSSIFFGRILGSLGYCFT